MLSEFDISVMYPRAQKSQALSDLLTYSSNNDEDWTPKEIPGGLPEATVCDDEIQKKWIITFDGSSTSNGGGEGIVLTNPEGKNHTQAYKLSFDCTNNEAEYEALILGMTAALNMEVKEVVIKGDSKLVIQQVKGEFSVKEPSLVIYRAMVQELAKNFQERQFAHMPRTQNRYADALATMASKVEVSETQNLRRPYQEYFQDKVTPCDKKEKEKLLRRISKYCLKDNNDLYRKGFNGKLLRCISNEEAEEVMKEIHHGDCREHQGGRKLYEEVEQNTCSSNLSTICDYSLAHLSHGSHRSDFTTFSRKNLDLSSNRMFHKMGRSNPIEKDLYRNCGNFILEYIICRFGIPKRILSDNATPFTRKATKKLLEDYKISHGKSTRHYPQGNGIAEAFNKLLLRVLSRMVHDSPTIWHEFVPLALWTYRTSKQGSTGFTPFSLVYGSKAVLPAEIAVPFAKLAMAARMDVHQARLEELELVDERREKAKDNLLQYQRRMARAYDKLVRPRIFQKGELVLKATDHVMRGMHTTKFVPNWEGPYVIEEIKDSGYCILLNPNIGSTLPPTNIKYVKKYFSYYDTRS
ncbi:uncharacterized protein LOC133784830 [Humulus lupulus]|uniref:uncharacterized protein LOC133784830 n=1 Tax=Humulus lupulus TaxID=3486 RepID=UPI002B417230|nr:uncharacterized protein LOC133784830 [Humulus lupulus]